MTEPKQPEALHSLYEITHNITDLNTVLIGKGALNALNAENETLRTGYAAARLEIESLRARSVEPAGEYPVLPEPLEIDWPELHSHALGCGVEDRGLHNRYECAEYGWQDGVDKCAERVPDQIFDAGQMRAYVDADRAMRAAQPAPAAVAGPIGYGPKVTVRRSCSDCKVCNSESYAVQGDSGHYVYCEHPSLPESKYIGDTNWNTPHWCPVSAPTTQPAPAMREAVAKAIYDQWVYKDGWVAWVNGGNSFRQDDARRLADLAFAMAQAAPTTQPAPQQEAHDSLRTDALQSLSYCHGLKAGWNFCVAADEAGYARAMSAIPEALRALKQARQPSPAPQPSPASQGDALPTIKGASITGGYVVVTPAGRADDKATVLRDAILRTFPVNPAFTPKHDDAARAAQEGLSHG